MVINKVLFGILGAVLEFIKVVAVRALTLFIPALLWNTATGWDPTWVFGLSLFWLGAKAVKASTSRYWRFNGIAEAVVGGLLVLSEACRGIDLAWMALGPLVQGRVEGALLGSILTIGLDATYGAVEAAAHEARVTGATGKILDGLIAATRVLEAAGGGLAYTLRGWWATLPLTGRAKDWDVKSWDDL